jgi:hypothetical protein
VPLLGNQDQANRGIDWPAIVRTLLVQVVVVLALSGAVVFYLNWSSDAAWQEFMLAGESSAPDPNHQAQSSTPVHVAKGQIVCRPKK